MNITIFGNSSPRSRLNQLTATRSLTQVMLLAGPPAIGKRSHLLESLSLSPLQPDIVIPELSADDLREAFKDSLYAPCFSEFRAVVLDELGTASDASTSACLKLFEEPPASTRFFIITEDPGSLSDPLLSRIQETIVFTALSESEMQQVRDSLDLHSELASQVCLGRPGIYKEIASDMDYSELWNAVFTACNGPIKQPSLLLPKKIRNLAVHGSLGRLATMMVCSHAAKEALSSGADKNRVCRLLEFSSTLLHLTRFDACAHWVRSIL
ncbi:MAG TPA: hypothetical protein VIE65_14155 [Methylobacter sp.]